MPLVLLSSMAKSESSIAEAKRSRDNYHHGDLAEALMEITLELIREQGLDHVSLREAAKRAGVSPGAPFRHFPNKTALISAICDQSEQQMTQAVRSALDTAKDDGPVTRLEALGRSYMQWALANPERMLLMHSHSLVNVVGINRVYQMDDSIKEVLVGLLEEAREQGVLRNEVDIHYAVICARALGFGLVHMAIQGVYPRGSPWLHEDELANALAHYNRLLCT